MASTLGQGVWSSHRYSRCIDPKCSFCKWLSIKNEPCILNRILLWLRRSCSTKQATEPFVKMNMLSDWLCIAARCRNFVLQIHSSWKCQRGNPCASLLCKNNPDNITLGWPWLWWCDRRVVVMYSSMGKQHYCQLRELNVKCVNNSGVRVEDKLYKNYKISDPCFQSSFMIGNYFLHNIFLMSSKW